MSSGIRKEALLTWGLRPQTPGIYRFSARIRGKRTPAALASAESRPLSRRSGCVPAEPCLPLRSYQYSGGETITAERPFTQNA
jgi:hypothetical protein